MSHRLVRETVLEHRSLGFPRQAAFSLQKFTKKTAAWIPLTYSAYKPFLGYCAQSYVFLSASC